MDWQVGDIAACYGGDLLGKVISYGTASMLAPAGLRVAPSHVAIYCKAADGLPLWVESTTLAPRPCAVRKVTTSGARADHPFLRVVDYVAKGGQVDIYRLTDIDTFDKSESELLTRILLEHFVKPGRRYDTSGAILSGTRVFQLSRLFPVGDIESVFCSELVAAVLMRLGRMNRGNPSRYNPGRLLRQLVRAGTYRRVKSYDRTTIKV